MADNSDMKMIHFVKKHLTFYSFVINKYNTYFLAFVYTIFFCKTISF